MRARERRLATVGLCNSTPSRKGSQTIGCQCSSLNSTVPSARVSNESRLPRMATGSFHTNISRQFIRAIRVGRRAIGKSFRGKY